MNNFINFNWAFNLNRVLIALVPIISGGNQRELARQKNQKKQVEQQKKKAADDKDGNKGMSLEERRQRWFHYWFLPKSFEFNY